MKQIKPITLLAGSHEATDTTGQGCFMNVIAYLNGEEQITDKSPCVCVTIRPIAIWLNDFADNQQRQKLLPFVLRALGSATENRAVLSERVAAVVEYAEFNARLASTYAKYAKYAKYAAESAKYAKYAAKYAESAKYAAESAAESAEYAESRQAIFQAGLDYLEKVCPPLGDVDEVVLGRAEHLSSLSAHSSI